MILASAQWAPMRWPAAWRDAALLGLLEGTPINCLVDPPPPVAERARAAGLAVAGSEVVWTERAKAPWASPAPVLAFTDAVWPGVPMSRGGGGAHGGPTGLPWVDANGWLADLARALAPEKAIWLAHQPKADSVLRAQAYQTAVADAQAYGARWVVSLDEKLAAALAARAPEALETWKAIVSALAFFDARKEWNRFQTKASLAVISDYSGQNEFLAAEILNLLTRRGVPQQIVLKSRAAQTKFEGLKGIVYADAEPPDPALAKRLAAFVMAGGFLLAGPKYPAPQGEPAGSDVHHRYDLRRVGKGRIALAKEDLADPYLVAADAQLILSHRYDPVRFFNSSTLIPYYTTAPDGRRALLQAINYAMRPGSGPVSVAFTRPYRSARFWQLGAAAPEKLELTPVEMGVEAYLPQFGVYAAIELE